MEGIRSGGGRDAWRERPEGEHSDAGKPVGRGSSMKAGDPTVREEFQGESYSSRDRPTSFGDFEKCMWQRPGWQRHSDLVIQRKEKNGSGGSTL